MLTSLLEVSNIRGSITFKANPNDFIEMKFDLTTIDTLQGLHAYMNTMLSSNEEVMRFCLRKVTHFWGFKEGSYVYYMVAPPWVKTLVVSFSSLCKRVNLERCDKHDKEHEREKQSEIETWLDSAAHNSTRVEWPRS